MTPAGEVLQPGVACRRTRSLEDTLAAAEIEGRDVVLFRPNAKGRR